MSCELTATHTHTIVDSYLLNKVVGLEWQALARGITDGPIYDKACHCVANIF